MAARPVAGFPKAFQFPSTQMILSAGDHFAVVCRVIKSRSSVSASLMNPENWNHCCVRAQENQHTVLHFGLRCVRLSSDTFIRPPLAITTWPGVIALQNQSSSIETGHSNLHFSTSIARKCRPRPVSQPLSLSFTARFSIHYRIIRMR